MNMSLAQNKLGGLIMYGMLIYLLVSSMYVDECGVCLHDCRVQCSSSTHTNAGIATNSESRMRRSNALHVYMRTKSTPAQMLGQILD